jgi:hypothetical protein
MAVDSHLAGLAPAFTSSQCRRENSRKSPLLIAATVSSNHIKKKKDEKFDNPDLFDFVVQF